VRVRRRAPYPYYGWPLYVGPAYPYYPYYHAHVLVWSGPSYPEPSPEVRRLALPEGVIKAGGEISGFLYFQNALERADRLELVWHVRTPRGQELATLKIPFVIVAL
jgi:hypothetical protein